MAVAKNNCDSKRNNDNKNNRINNIKTMTIKQINELVESNPLCMDYG